MQFPLGVVIKRHYQPEHIAHTEEQEKDKNFGTDSVRASGFA